MIMTIPFKVELLYFARNLSILCCVLIWLESLSVCKIQFFMFHIIVYYTGILCIYVFK